MDVSSPLRKKDRDSELKNMDNELQNNRPLSVNRDSKLGGFNAQDK